jgi:hypothetical protein
MTGIELLYDPWGTFSVISWKDAPCEPVVERTELETGTMPV